MLCMPVLIYQYAISPCFKPCCRYYPSCSQYTLQAIKIHGIFKGLLMSFKRIIKCHPWSKGGYDPVIINKEKN